MEEYIKLLELPEEFDLAALKKAYRQKVLKYHPDKAANEAERIGYEALMKKLNEANECLKEYLENNGGIYTKPTENDTSNYSEDTSAEENYTEENTQSTEEETQDFSYEYEEPQKENEPNEGLLKIKNWVINNPIKATIIVCIIIQIFLLNNQTSTSDTNYTPLENSQVTTQTEAIQNYNQQKSEQPETSEAKENTIVDVTYDKNNPMNRYMSNLHRRIKMNWSLPKSINHKNIRVTVAFKLDKYGQIVDKPQIKQSSGNEIIDKSCINAVMLTAPFGTLPENISQDIVSMEMLFEADKH